MGRGSDDAHLGVVNPKELVLITDTFIPSKIVSWGVNPISNTDDALWITDFGIGSMDISASDLNCTQTITVEKDDGAGWVDYSSHFNYTVNTKKAPAGLWGEKIRPDVNDARFIGEAFAGLEIVPANPPIPGASNLIDRSFVQYETSPVANAIKWETRDAFTDAGLTEANARSTINSSIKTNAIRDTLLDDLGMSSTIDLTDSIANDLILTPQVEQTV